MKPHPRFQAMPKLFWAYVRSISEWVGYTHRGTKKVKVPSPAEMRECLIALRLAPDSVVSLDLRLTELGCHLAAYFEQRAAVLNLEVEPALMDAAQAAKMFARLRKQLGVTSPVAMNKQKGQ